MADTIKILAIGDVVSESGCEALRKKLPRIKKENEIDVCVVNGENSALGNGMTPISCEHIFTSGADVITGGNHSFKRREVYDLLDNSLSVLRPANYNDSCPGTGVCTVDKGAYSVTVINMLGTVFCEPLKNPFDCIDEILEGTDSNTKIIIVDFHAEATAEKKAFAYYVDGRVSAVFGTHTHVQTADEQILDGGTGYITDAGMTGPCFSVIGVKPSLAIQKMRTNMPVRFENAEGECRVQGVIFEIEKSSGKTVSVKRIDI